MSSLFDSLTDLDHFASDADLGAAVEALVLDDARSTRFRLATAALLRVEGEVPAELPAARVDLFLDRGVTDPLATGEVSREEVRTLLGNPAQFHEFHCRALSEDTYFSRRIEAEVFCEALLDVVGQRGGGDPGVAQLSIAARGTRTGERQAAFALPPVPVLERSEAAGGVLRAAASCRVRLDDGQRRLGYLHVSLTGAEGRSARLFLLSPEDLEELRQPLERGELTYPDLPEKILARLSFRRSADAQELLARCRVPQGLAVFPSFLVLVE
jgi:hypothetical protein